MAKLPPKVSNNAKVKFRIFEFEMDGSDDSIQDTMKTLAAALTRGGHGAVSVQRRIKGDEPTPPTGASEADADAELVDDENPVEDVVPKATTSPKRPKKIKTYDILDDIRFDETPIALADFVAQYSPKSDLKRYLVIALWFKEQWKLKEINDVHWYTAYKYLKWSIPSDPAQPIRDLRASKRLSKGTAVGHAFINIIGERELQEIFKDAE